MAASGRSLFSLYSYIENLKNLLVRNHWTDFHIILQKCSFGDPLPILFKPFGFVKKHSRRCWGWEGVRLIFPIYQYRKLKKSVCQKPLERLQYNVAEMFLWWSSTKIVQAIWIHQKTWGGFIFPIYLYRKTWKIFLSETTGLISLYFGKIVSLVTLYQDCSSNLDLSKNMAARGWSLFSLHIYIENLKKFLVRNHWTDFNIPWQKCFLGDPLPRLFKPSWFVKKHGC